MKKLTAGIFATILGLTAVDAFAAKVASTTYVQGAIDSLATVAKTGAYGDLTGKPSIPSIEGLATEAYVDQAEADAISSAKSYTDSEIGEIGDMTVKAYVDAAKNEATYDDTALAGRVTTAVGKITTIEGQQTTQDAAIKALQDANYAPQATTYTKTEVDNLITASEYDDTALAGRVTTAEGKITTIEGQQTTQDAAIAAAQQDATQALADAAAENEVNAAQQQVIDNLGTTYVKVSDVVDEYVAPTAL